MDELRVFKFITATNDGGRISRVGDLCSSFTVINICSKNVGLHLLVVLLYSQYEIVIVFSMKIISAMVRSKMILVGSLLFLYLPLLLVLSIVLLQVGVEY